MPPDRLQMIDAEKDLKLVAQLAVNGSGHLYVAWESEDEKPNVGADQPPLGGVLCKLLGNEDQRWQDDEWRRMIGLERETDWIRRIILLARAQLKARESEYLSARYAKKQGSSAKNQGSSAENQGCSAENQGSRAFLLPDKQAISTALLWPPSQPKAPEDPLKNPLTRLPEIVVLVALRDVLKLENERRASEQGFSAWSNAELAEQLVAWLQEKGATDEWLRGRRPCDDPLIRKTYIGNLRTTTCG